MIKVLIDEFNYNVFLSKQCSSLSKGIRTCSKHLVLTRERNVLRVMSKKSTFGNTCKFIGKFLKLDDHKNKVSKFMKGSKIFFKNFLETFLIFLISLWNIYPTMLSSMFAPAWKKRKGWFNLGWIQWIVNWIN